MKAHKYVLLVLLTAFAVTCFSQSKISKKQFRSTFRVLKSDLRLIRETTIDPPYIKNIIDPALFNHTSGIEYSKENIRARLHKILYQRVNNNIEFLEKSFAQTNKKFKHGKFKRLLTIANNLP